MNLSYWEKSSFINYDIIIVGGGLVGLSTAISIKEKAPHKRILVLERGLLPCGASTKNAGFACIGSLTELLDDLSMVSESEAIALVNLRKNGLLKLRQRLGDANIGYQQNGSYELISANESDAIEQIKRINNLLYTSLLTDAFELADEMIDKFNFDKKYCHHLIRNNCEGEIHTGKMMRSLLDLCIASGVEIKTGAQVKKIEETTNEVRIYMEHEELIFTADHVVVCNNAFAKTLFPTVDVKPGRGQVIITKPIPTIPFKGIFHFDKGYYYFREIEGRVLLGGGRNLDFEGETTTDFGKNEFILQNLIHILKTKILPNRAVEIDYSWSGIMAFGENKFPIVRQVSARQFVGVRMGGMGVAIGSQTGEQLAELVLATGRI